MPRFPRIFRPFAGPRLLRPLAALAVMGSSVLTFGPGPVGALAQEAQPPSRRSSPFERGPGASPGASASTPTPIPQTAVREAPAVVLPPSTSAASPGAARATDADLSLEVQNEPDGAYVTFSELLRIIRQIHPDARANWDGLLGVFRLEAAGHSLQALSERPILVVDGRTLAMVKPLRVRDGIALIPAATVNEIFRSLDFEFQLPEGSLPSGASQASGPSSVAPGGSPDGRPASRTDALASGGSLLSEVSTSAIPPIDLPQLGESIAGLKWADLTDYAHPREPRRMTLVYDEAFGALAQAVAELSRRAGGLEVAMVEVAGRRDDPALIAQIARSQPEVLLDLVSLPGDKDRRFQIWTVHEALWSPRAKGPGPEARSLQELYAPHQFHNLALGSMLRSELARAFPDSTVRLELSPCYLLRRVDAPSAAILIPEKLAGGDDRELERIARAVGGGFVGYSAGLRSARR